MTEPAVNLDEKPNIQQNAVILALAVGKPGNRKKVASSQVEVDADRDLVHVSKELLDCQEYDAIQQHDANFKNGYLRSRCLPSFFKNGFYLLPVRLVEEVDERLKDFSTRRAELVEQFLAVYPTRVEEIRQSLRSLFNEADYPPVEQLRAAFYVSTRYLTFSTPNTLRGIKQEIFQREREKSEKFWAEASVEVQNALRESMAELVSHMIDRLTEDSEGRPKRLRASMFEKMNEFLDLFQKRNIADDAEMEKLVLAARSLMRGIDAETLKKDLEARANVREGFAKVKETLDSMLEERPKRRIVFED